METAQETAPQAIAPGIETPKEVEGVETPKTDTEPEVKEDPKFARRFAALSRQEKQIVAKSKEVEDKAKEVESIKAEAERMKGVMALARENPMKFLEETGISYQELTELMLAAEKTPEDKKIDELRKEFEDLKQAKEREAKEVEEANLKAQIERATQAIGSYKVQCKEMIQQNPDKYELILAQGREDDVFNIVEQYFIENEKELGSKAILDFDIAADYLEQLLFEEGQKLIQTKKFAPAKKQDAIREKTKDARDTHKPSPTLTNTKTSGYAPSIKPTSQQDAFKRAVAILESE